MFHQKCGAAETERYTQSAIKWYAWLFVRWACGLVCLKRHSPVQSAKNTELHIYSPV